MLTNMLRFPTVCLVLALVLPVVAGAQAASQPPSATGQPTPQVAPTPPAPHAAGQPAPEQAPHAAGQPAPKQPQAGAAARTALPQRGPATTGRAAEAPVAGQPGHWKVVQERVWVEGSLQRVWVDAVYATARGVDGNPVEVLVEPGQYREVRVPGRFELRERRVWVPTPHPAPAGSFTLRNSRQFQVQLQSINVALADGSSVLIALPRDRVISSLKLFTFHVPEGAVAVTVRFKTWDWGNRRFRFPIHVANYLVSRGNGGIIH